MKRFRMRPIEVEAVQVTEATFALPHPNPEHLEGVTYDPRFKCAYIDTTDGAVRARIGDWIIRSSDGALWVRGAESFAANYEEAGHEATWWGKPVSQLTAQEREQMSAFLWGRE